MTTEADGTLVVSGDIALIAFERRLSHPIEAVWAALTEPDDLAVWFGPGTIEHCEGGQVEIRTGYGPLPEQQRTISGRVLAWEPPRVLEHEWLQPGLEVSVVRYELEPDAAGTVLRFTHRRSATPGIGGRAGWHAYLDRLAAHLGHFPVPAWQGRRAEVQDAYGEAPLPGASAEGR